MHTHRNRFLSFCLAAAIGLNSAAVEAHDALREPLPPGNAAPTLRLPPRDASGDFVTPNRALDGERAFWNLRIALNVAAIGCRGAGSAALVADYNQLLQRHALLIRSSETQVIAGLARSSGGNGIAARDKLSTRMFNYFAQPPAQSEFCDQAADVASEVAASSSDQVPQRAGAWLAKLDQPFVDFYDAYDRYQVERTAWQALSRERGISDGDIRQARLEQEH